MITEERVLDFIRSFGVDRGSEALHMIEKEAIRDDVPIIRKESGELLRILLQIKKPEKILEVGAAIGFSSVFMGENKDNNTHITTIIRRVLSGQKQISHLPEWKIRLR